MNILYTIGYSSYTTDTLIEVLLEYGITAVADVRSVPYSSYRKDFNKENLKNILKANSIEYVFLGDYLGAKIEDSTLYINGKADYNLISKHPVFQKGLERIRSGSKKYVIVLMCAEKDPIVCHRTILISRNLRKEFNIQHILDNGKLEPHLELETRLIRIHSLDQLRLPGLGNNKSSLIEAYKIQSQKIAYRAEN